MKKLLSVALTLAFIVTICFYPECLNTAFADEIKETCLCPSGIPTSVVWIRISKSPTCMEEGERIGRCGVCKTHFKRTIAKVPHEYLPATCTEPQTCKHGCGTTQGSPLGHDFPPATCLTPRFCQRSGCSAKDYTVGNHSFNNPNCQNYKVCTVCGYESILPGDHVYSSATCTTPKTCIYCGAQTGSPIAHKYTTATCIKKATCKLCGVETGSYAAHNYVNDVCTVCGRIISIQDKNPGIISEE